MNDKTPAPPKDKPLGSLPNQPPYNQSRDLATGKVVLPTAPDNVKPK